MIKLLKHIFSKQELINDIDELIKINHELLVERCRYKRANERTIEDLETAYEIINSLSSVLDEDIDRDEIDDMRKHQNMLRNIIKSLDHTITK